MTYEERCKNTKRFSMIPYPKNKEEYALFKERFYTEYDKHPYLTLIKWDNGEDDGRDGAILDYENELEAFNKELRADQDRFGKAWAYFDMGRIQLGICPSGYNGYGSYDEFDGPYEELSREDLDKIKAIVEAKAKKYDIPPLSATNQEG